MLNQIFISYRHESPEHAHSVRRLGELLRQAKLPVVLDQFFLDDRPGGPEAGWPKWCEDCANESRCVLIVGSEGWFAAYDKKNPPGLGLGAASEADLFRQSLWDEKGYNDRIRLVFVDDLIEDRIPIRLRAWHHFRPFSTDEQLNQLIRWLARELGLAGIQTPTVSWPVPMAFKPDLADRNKMEWPTVVNLLAGSSRERIILLEADSGLGKSELVRQATIYAKRLGIPVALVNLKGVVTVEDILGQIDLELGLILVSFSREGANKTHLLRKDLRALRQPVLLIFDSYEAVADNRAIADWLSQQLLIEIETALGVSVVIAGQRVPDFRKAMWRELALHITLQPITDIQSWEEWVALRYPTFYDKGDLSTVLKLAGGNPSVIANFCALIARS